MIIDAQKLGDRELNRLVREYARISSEIVLKNVLGQRYIGCGMTQGVKITIEGVPGNDLAAFMNGPEILVQGNAQDGVGNTMNSGRVIIRGNAGDILGHSMRGGRIYVQGSVGYRTGIHIKSYKDQLPIIVIGGTAGDYLGEYMAGGVVIVLGLVNSAGKEIVGRYMGTGMHGGALYICGEIPESRIGLEVAKVPVADEERIYLSDILSDYFKEIPLEGTEPDQIITRLNKYVPVTTRPYGNLYAY